MAPKSPAKRITRARTAAKKEDILSGPARKPAPSKVTKNTTTRKIKATNDEEPVEEVEQPRKTATRTTTKTTRLVAAPRRRIKVTPLDAPAVEEPATEPRETAKSKKTTTRSKKSSVEEMPVEEAASELKPVPTKTRARAAKTTDKKAPVKEPAAPKTRGRPKRAAASEPEEAKEPEPAKTTRQTRTRAASSAEPIQEPVLEKPKAVTRKKVTFQDLPEDDKENLPVPTKKTTAKKETPATGMRAKPVRKPATAPKKTTTTTRSRVDKPAPRALTPKKITQVNRAPTPEESDGEDELMGAKTPVRDLSVSPKRNPQFAAILSPAKKLDFGQSSLSMSPNKASEATMLMSPARRPPGAAEKETMPLSPLKESPKRGDFASIFPTTSQQTVTAATALMPTAQPNLLQSPKRVHLDPSVFSQSTMKPKQSPFKASLLQSPARRLFSPKKSAPATTTKVFADFPTQSALGTPEDLTVSSHFRASVSPQRFARVHRMSDEELADELAIDVDFDQSVLNVRSPLKVMKEKPSITLAGEDKDEIDEDIAHAQDEKENEVPAVVEEMVRDSEAVKAIAPGDVEVILPKNDHQAVIDEMVQDSASVKAVEPSKIEIVLPAHDSELVAAESDVDQVEEEMADLPAQAPRSARRLSGILFRSERAAEEESSEDELAGDNTPARAPRTYRPSLTGATARFRQSTGIPGSVSRGMGFTPLAAQMSGWLAASPEKKALKKTPKQRSLFTPMEHFSPAAAEHIDGEVTISRQSTPKQCGSPVVKHSTAKKQSFEPRISLAVLQDGTPERTSFFEDQMVDHETGGQMEDVQQQQAEDIDMHVDAQQIDDALAAEGPEPAEAEEEQTAEEEGDTVLVEEPSGELTTDLIKFTNASYTAMVDFETLAKEAEEMAPDGDESEEVYGDENAAPAEGREIAELEQEIESIEEQAIELQQTIEEPIELTEPIVEQVVKDTAITEEQQPIEAVGNGLASSPSPSPRTVLGVTTPTQQDFSLPRFVNTMVSKVPLRPEGNVSPIKMPKKRARSLSNAAQDSSPKRVALTPIGKLAARATSDYHSSPSRAIRSAAPSPAMTTPGQTSFAVDDFGDSTLDGIDLPEDEMDFEIGNPSLVATTPATAKSTKTVKSAGTAPARTPLKPLNQGILSGAVVYVEVHTTEGADASGVYIDLLSQMGAKCIKDWKWNPRASMGSEEAANAKLGITHVIYKDGGKRTLEKVRSAKGEVCCVGVRWVLDCERENKWLDEIPYVVDQSIIPRGGSRRRKSMEPRALINENGALSAKSGRRTSAEFLTTAMREDLVNTPVRTFSPIQDDTEISSSYNSPTTTMNIKNPGMYSTPDELKGWDPATSMTPAPLSAKKTEGKGLKSAPPKRINKGLFDRDEDSEKESVKGRKGDGRRQTMGVGMQWVPRVRSPLGKF